jgi:hypothetical protein
MVKQHSDRAQAGALGAARATRYAEVAAQIARFVERGAYRPGERVPSVGALSRQLRVGNILNRLCFHVTPVERKKISSACRSGPGSFVATSEDGCHKGHRRCLCRKEFRSCRGFE